MSKPVLTGVQDVDRLILSDVPYEILRPFCLSSTYTVSLCNQTFWRNLFVRDYVDLGTERTVDYRKVYADIRKIEQDDVESLWWSSVEYYIAAYAVKHDYDALFYLEVKERPTLTINDRLIETIIQYGRMGPLNAVLKAKTPLEYSLRHYVQLAATYGHLDMFIQLRGLLSILYPGAESSDQDSFQKAVKANRVNILRYLDRKVESEELMRAIPVALKNDNLDVLRYLVEEKELELTLAHLKGSFGEFSHGRSIDTLVYTVNHLHPTVSEIVDLALISSKQRYSNATNYLLSLPTDQELRQYADAIVVEVIHNDNVSALRYLVEDRNLVHREINLQTAVDQNASSIFMYLLESLPLQQQERVVRLSLLDAIRLDRDNIVSSILSAYYDGVYVNLTPLIVEALISGAIKVLTYLLTISERSSVYKDNPNELYTLAATLPENEHRSYKKTILEVLEEIRRYKYWEDGQSEWSDSGDW